MRSSSSSGCEPTSRSSPRSATGPPPFPPRSSTGLTSCSWTTACPGWTASRRLRSWSRRCPKPSADERGLRTPPAEQAAQFESVSRDMMRFALEDLAVLPPSPTVVEGPQILPDLVPPGDEAVFLDPTPEFQRSVLEPRPMPSSDPEQALANRLVKDRLYADRVAGLARERGFPVVV